MFGSDIDLAMKETLAMINNENPESIKDLILRYGLGTFKALKDWVNSHITNNIEAEINWDKNTNNAVSKRVEISKLNRVKNILEPKETQTVEQIISTSGILQGFNYAASNFNIKLEEEEDNVITGTIDNNLAHEQTTGKTYNFKIIKRIQINNTGEKTSFVLTDIIPV